MSGKAAGIARGVEGLPGDFAHYMSALGWMVGQTQLEPQVRAAWMITYRRGRWWAFPPTMAAYAAEHPDWTP